MESLTQLIDSQREFQRLVGAPIDSTRESDRNEMGEKYLFKAIEEIIELRKEFPSILNPWSKEQKLADTTRIKEEFSDVLLFLINFMIVWKITPEEMIDQLKQVQDYNFLSLKGRKMDALNREILSVPTYVSGVGQGSHRAKYVFIGQNPGKDIDHGYKFWSNPADGSSKVLLPALEKVGILGTSYFTNAVKSTTPDNSEPTPEALDFWSTYLIRELEILKIGNPDIKVILMGTWTTQSLPVILRGYILRSIAHPDSILYGNKTQERYEQDIQEAIK